MALLWMAQAEQTRGQCDAVRARKNEARCLFHHVRSWYVSHVAVYPPT